MIPVLIWIYATTVLVASNWSYPRMSCSYGERGSLTAFCVNASTKFFKLTPYRFDHLDETLKCINCTLTSLDSGTFDINGNQIRTLDIRNSSIHEIWPKAFIGLIFMEKLLLSNNPISIMHREAFIGIRKVKYVEIENSLSNLDAYVLGDLHLLEVLNLRKNKLSVMDSNAFVGLGNLKILDLSFNQLRTLNDCFAPLTSLKVLRLQNNQIARISGSEFSNLLVLVELNLESNDLTSFTININPNNKLKVLNLARNRLSSNGVKAETFKDLNNLEDLDLSKNLFTVIPPKFFQGLFLLRNLNLYANKIQVFSTGTFSGLPHLLNLNLSRNQLELATITGQLSLHSLHTLDLSNNHIKEFDYITFISTMPRITYINLLNNFLPCETVSEIEILFKEDNVRFLMDDQGLKNCNSVSESPNDIIMGLMDKRNKYSSSNKSEAIWIVLICIIIFLVGILCYVQFCVLHRLPQRTYSIRVFSNPGTSA